MWNMFWMTVAFVGGYAASIYSWPTIKMIYVSADNEIEALKARIEKLKGGL